MENDTVFGKIIRGEIPATKVYEDDAFLALLDINPVAKGHTLLIPKKHYVWIHETPDDLVAAIFIKAKELINAMRKGIPCDFVQIGVVGDEIPHLHIHLIPRFKGQNTEQTSRPHIPYASAEEKQEYAEKIKKGLG
jgi:histidine triad (HIT) family protein